MDSDRAVVTGGASGLGAVIARRLHQQGFHVVLLDRDQDAGAQLAAQLGSGPGATFVECELLDRARLVAIAERLASAPVRLLVNNAGGWLPGPQFPDGDSWEDGLALNLQVPMLLTKIMLPALSGGSVVNIASSGGWDSGPYGSPEYGAAKAGLIRFSTAAARLTDRGVRVSCIVPHWIGLPRAQLEFRQLSPAEQWRSGGLVDPEVIAETVITHTEDSLSAGRVNMIRPQLPPYDVDPADYDPHRPA